MKKLISFILTAAIVMSLCIIPSFVSAEGSEVGNPINPDLYRYGGFVTQEMIDLEIQRTTEGGYNKVLEVDQYVYFCFNLVERYYHFNRKGEMDWLLFEAASYMSADWFISALVGEWFLSREMEESNIPFGIGIYDIEEDKFYSILDASVQEKYNKDINEALAYTRYKVLFGDVNGDRRLNINDATLIQKYTAKVIEYPANDTFRNNPAMIRVYGSDKIVQCQYISDFNHDTVRDVNDVTALQKYIAKLPYRVEITGSY